MLIYFQAMNIDRLRLIAQQFNSQCEKRMTGPLVGSEQPSSNTSLTASAADLGLSLSSW